MVDPKMKIQHNEHMKNQFNWVIFKICTIVYTIYLTYIDLGLGLKLIWSVVANAMEVQPML